MTDKCITSTKALTPLPVVGYAARRLVERRHVEAAWLALVAVMSLLLAYMTFGQPSALGIALAVLALLAMVLLAMFEVHPAKSERPPTRDRVELQAQAPSRKSTQAAVFPRHTPVASQNPGAKTHRTAERPSSLLGRIVCSIPVVGYGARCLAEERYEQLAWLGLVVGLAAVVNVLAFGFSGFITMMKVLVALAFLLVLSATV